MTYARDTSVPVRRSRQEIEEMLENHRALRTYTGQEPGRAMVGFELADRRIQFELHLPALTEFETRVVRGRKVKASPEQQQREWEQACRQKWRALVLALKSKFVSIESGIETVEEAFLAHVVLPNRQTVGNWFKAQLQKAYDTEDMPPLLGSGEGP